MNLVDVLMGGLVFSLASASSLHIYGSSLRWAQGQDQRQALANAMELAMAQGTQQLRQQRDAAALDEHFRDCSVVAADLLAELNETSGSQGVVRQVYVQGEVVSITVEAPGLPLRRRWFSPAAYGLCGQPTPPSGAAAATALARADELELLP